MDMSRLSLFRNAWRCQALYPLEKCFSMSLTLLHSTRQTGTPVAWPILEYNVRWWFREVNKLARGECNSDFFRNWVGSHQHERSEEVKDFQQTVDGRLSPDQEETVMAKPMPRFVKARILVRCCAILFVTRTYVMVPCSYNVLVSRDKSRTNILCSSKLFAVKSWRTVCLYICYANNNFFLLMAARV